MNDRIEQLKREAIGFYMKYSWSTMDQQDLAIFSEKFAELIVRECASIADKAEPYKANDLILKHFGVE